MLTWKVPDGSDSVDLRCVECTRKDHTSNMSLFEEVDGIGWNWMELDGIGCLGEYCDMHSRRWLKAFRDTCDIH